MGLKDKLEKKILDEKQKNETPEIYLFLSFDLVNATEFKIRNQDWQSTFTKFYTFIKKQITKDESPLQKCSVWKYIGDEVLFYVKITDKEQLFKLLPFIEKIVKETEKHLHDYSIYFDKLSIKSTIWIAEVYENNANIPQHKAKNIKFESFETPGIKYEFLGPDIDLGFRISKYSRKNIVALDAKLAYLLYKNRQYIKDNYHYEVEKCIKIVDYKQLKGIMRGRYYPIIWFSSTWNCDVIFSYDEIINNKENADLKQKIESKKLDNLERIEKIFIDTNQQDPTEEILSIIESSEDEHKFYEFKSYAEVHVAVICFHENKVLVFQRSQDKAFLPGKWEFGCGQVKPNETFIDTAKRAYKEDFNLNIQPHHEPVAIYEIDKNGQKIPGIILYGIVDDLENINLRGGHAEKRLIDKSEIETIDENDFVPDFKNNVLKAFELYEKYKTK